MITVCKPKLRFPNFEGEWKKIKGKQMFNVLGGGSFSSNDSQNSGVKWLKIANVGINKIVSNEISHLPQKFQTEYKKYLLKKDDIVVALTRPTLSSKLKIALINDYFDGSLLNQRVGKIIPCKNSTKNFIYYLLQLDKTIGYIENQISGSDPPNLSIKDLLNIPLIVPSIPEQQKIASFLSKIDEKIDLLEKKLQLWETYKKGMMQQIFSQKLRFKDENGEDYPDWEEKKLDDICNINKGSQLSKTEMIENGEYYVLNGGIEPSGYTNEWNTPKNTITISEGGNSCGYVNYNIENFWSGGHCYSLEILKNIDISFLYQTLKHMENHIMRLRVGSGLPNIQKKDLQNFKIIIPNKIEQMKIGDLFLSIDNMIYYIKIGLNEIQKFKKGLLQQMFC